MFTVGQTVVCINARHDLVVGTSYTIATVTPAGLACTVEGSTHRFDSGRFQDAQEYATAQAAAQAEATAAAAQAAIDNAEGFEVGQFPECCGAATVYFEGNEDADDEVLCINRLNKTKANLITGGYGVAFGCLNHEQHASSHDVMTTAGWELFSETKARPIAGDHNRKIWSYVLKLAA